jgi:hypothetical protein
MGVEYDTMGWLYRGAWKVAVLDLLFKVLFAVVFFVYSSLTWASDGKSSLEYVDLKVNDQVVAVKKGEEVVVVKGDTLTIIDARLLEGKARKVNFIGFVPTNAKIVAEDRGFVIDTLNALMPEWQKNDRYVIQAYSENHIHGEVFVRVIEPELSYVEVEINGEAKVLRAGSEFSAHSKDELSVKNIVTNIENDGEKVQFEIRPIRKREYRLVFMRKGYVFAQIKLKVSGIE